MLRTIPALAEVATGRSVSLLDEDCASLHSTLCARIRGRRVLIVGAAGSIASATASLWSTYEPAALHLIDHNENNLAELMRDFRNRDRLVRDLRALPLDFGAPVMARFLADQAAYDFVLNFAAVKHVRSEKDVYSLMHMLDTNIVKPARFLGWLMERAESTRYFCVSTDKAAHPSSLMGASKRVMEHLSFSLASTVSSARFGNVAFSDGSLLDSFIKRLAKCQPLAVPANTRRYFLSLQEAAQLCLLTAVCAPSRTIVIPRLETTALQELETVATLFLRLHQLQPRIYRDEQLARAAVASDLEKGEYPLLVTDLDTSGEKSVEQFIGPGESSNEIGMRHLVGIAYSPPTGRPILNDKIAELERIVSSPRDTTSKADLISLLAALVPELRHVETQRCLDERM